MAIIGKLVNPVTQTFGKAIKNLVEDVVEETVKETTKKVKGKVGRPKRKRGRKKADTPKRKKVKTSPATTPTGTATERLAALRKTKKGKKGSKERQRRGEIGRLTRQSEQASRAEQFAPPPERGGRTSTIDPTTGQAVAGGVNTQLLSLHRPDYKRVHDQAVAHLKRKFPGKTEVWYENRAIELIEREFPQFEQGQQYVAGTTEQVGEMLRGRKRGGIVRRKKGGAIGVGAALRGYGKGYKKGGKI